MTGQMERLLEGVAVFMKALLPAYYIALTGACGVATATAFYQMILILIFLTEKILLLFLLPAIRMYLVLELINFLTKEEFLSKMTELLNAGFTDTFRYFYPDAEGIYSWWSYRFKAREKNAGWRIDYFITSRRLDSSLTGAAIHTDVFGSDHCPVELTIEL